MSEPSITQQPQPTLVTFRLMPDEYIRFEYTYEPDCCCLSSKTTTVTNIRLLTNVIETPTIFSEKTSIGKEKQQIMYLRNINDVKQLKSAIPSSEKKWWMKCFDILTCSCSNENINWLELCHGTDNVAFDTNKSMVEQNNVREPSLIQRF